jgi:hypothetical protein
MINLNARRTLDLFIMHERIQDIKNGFMIISEDNILFEESQIYLVITYFLYFIINFFPLFFIK